MVFGLKKKFRSIGAGALSLLMVFGLLQSVPAGAFMMTAKAGDGSVGDMTWDFAKAAVEVVPGDATDGKYTVQYGKTTTQCEYNGLKISTPVSGSKFVFRLTGQNSGVGKNAQYNAGTVIDVPVKGDCSISVSCTAADFTVNGVAATDEDPDTKDVQYTYKYEGDEGYVSVVSTGANYMNSISVVHVVKPTLDTSKTDVWDFGGEALTGAYNNNIDYAFINGCYPDIAAGTTGKNITSFTAKDGKGADAFKFVTNKTNNRWRITPAEGAAVTCYDAKTKTDKDGNTYNGYLYSNNSGAVPACVDPATASDAHVEFYLYEGDILNCWLGSNGNAAVYSFVNAEGKELSAFNYTNQNPVEEATFCAPKEGWYTLYCTNEKLVLARATREHTPVVKLSGTVQAPESLSDYSVSFTNQSTGKVVNAKVVDGKYSVSLNGKYTYGVSLKNANGYVVYSDNTVDVGDADQTFAVQIKAVDLLTVSGKMTGISADAMSKLDLSFHADAVYVPEMTLDTATGDFSLKVEKGITYQVVAEGVNDYSLTTDSVVYNSACTDAEIAFSKKPTYKTTVGITGLGDLDTSTAKVTFTNIKEDGYSYTYGIGEDMMLRNGQYSVKVSGLGCYSALQGYTPDVKINDAPGATVVPMKTTDDWDFGKIGSTNVIETLGDAQYFAGLKLSGRVAINKNIYLLTNADSTVTIPNVKAGDVVTFQYCYCAAFQVGDLVVDEKSGSTTQIDTKSYVATEDGDLVVTGLTGDKSVQTYFTSISVNAAKDVVAYQSELKVGKDKEYKTINQALDAVRNMNRKEDQNVTIMIDPGNYEEMLVLDMPNITLKNASATPGTDLKNKGVDIADNAVRVTWYYGHGYTYYSMDNNSKCNNELLAVNKANGYASYVNTGTGTTNGSYWNATVVVSAPNVSADGIIFENSFNQYVSAAAANDVIESQAGAKNGTVKRDDLKTVGDTTVQDKKYVERAAALAIYNDIDQVSFNNCKIIGRQDTLFGGVGTKASFDHCSIYGGTDYIFGGMTAVFNKCNLVFNTSDNKDDVGYITAPQQASGRGYFMYDCRVTSTTPGVDTASEHTSKPGYFGRPWQSNTSEAVFYNTTVDAADEYWKTDEGSLGTSLIQGAGWLSTLSGESGLCGEYGTREVAAVDNQAKRVSWAKVFTEPKFADGSDMTFEALLGDWNPMTVDNKNLESAIDAGMAKLADSSKYTTESISALSTTIAKVTKAGLSNMTQMQSDAYAVEIMQAVDGLVVKDTPTPDPDPTPDPKPDPEPTPAQEQKLDTKSDDESADMLKNVVADKDVVVKDQDGNKIDLNKITLNIKITDESKKHADQVLAVNNVTFKDGSVVKYMDMKLNNKDGETLVLADGKIRVTFALDPSIDLSKVDVLFYHIGKDDVLTQIPVKADANGIVADIPGFSDFVLVYQPKATAVVDDQKPAGTTDVTNTTDKNDTNGTADQAKAEGSTGETVKTGDSAQPIIYLAIACASGLMLMGCYYELKKRKIQK